MILKPRRSGLDRRGFFCGWSRAISSVGQSASSTRKRPQVRFLHRPLTTGTGRLAQLGEHFPYKEGVAGSSPAPPIAGRLAQLARALPPHGRGRRFDSCIAHCDGVAEWLGAGLQSLIRGFDSRRRLRGKLCDRG